MIIDAHIHIGAWDHPDFLGRACSLDDAAAALASAGIGGAGIMPSDRCDNAGLLADARRVVAAQGAPRLWLLPWVRPVASGHPGADDLAWLEAHADDLAGIKIHPSLSRVRVTDTGFGPALELAAAHDLVALVHCGRWQEIASYRFAIEAAAARPQVRFLLAHAGGDTPPLATAAAARVAELGLDNVWFEFSGLREYWVVERNVALLGADRYLLGSDFPLAHPRMYLGAIDGMDLPDADKARIAGGNAEALLGTRWVR
jgi:hypothetical protein